MIAVSKGSKYVRGVVAMLALVAGTAAVGGAQSQPSGPFQVGDRIALTVETPMAITDTLAVRSGLVITVPNVGDIPLQGVRRADVQPYLKQQLGKYLRDPVLKAVVLVRIGVLGPVNRPGYYVVPSDAILSDVVQSAGGLSGMADPSKTVVRRGGKEVVGKGAVSQALASGRTVDNLGLASGDELVVGEREQRGFTSYLQLTSILLSLTVAVITLANRF